MVIITKKIKFLQFDIQHEVDEKEYFCVNILILIFLFCRITLYRKIENISQDLANTAVFC